MNKKQYISKLSAFVLFTFFVFFSCDNEKEVKTAVQITPFELEIDSVNASEFAKSFVQDIYNSDTVSARNKTHISYEGDASCVHELLTIDNVSSELDLFTQLNIQIMLGAVLNFSNYDSQSNEQIVWLRLFKAPLEVNFYRLRLKVENNKIVIQDYRSFTRGSNCVEMMKELTDLVCVSNTVDIQEIDRSFAYLDSTQMSFDRLDPESAGYYFSIINPALLGTSVIHAVKFNLELHSSSEIRGNALALGQYTVDEKFDTGLYNRLYYGLEKGDFLYARSAINELRNTVGNDPVLIYLEATTYFEAFDYERALPLYNDALIAEPTIPNIHFAKIICLVEMKEYTQAVESLLVMEDYFKVANINWDKEFMAYPEFLISDEYSQWLERVGAMEDEVLL